MSVNDSTLEETLEGGLEFLQFFVETQHSLHRFDSVDNSILLSVLTHRENYGHDSESVKEIDSDISEIASFLIQNGACCGKDKAGNRPLHIAAKNGYLSTIDVLLQLNSGSIYDQNEAGETALHICLKHPKENVFEVVKRLFESTNLKQWSKLQEVSVLYLATVAAQQIYSYDHDRQTLTSQLVKLLLGNGADPNNHSDDDIPLLSALEARDLQTSTFLLDSSADINATDCNGKSGLHIILDNYTKENDLCLTQLLVEKGINVNLVDNDGKSALIYLIEKYDRYGDESAVSSFEEIFKVLVKHGADLNLANTLEETVLSFFCTSGTNVEIGNILLKNGADPKIGFCLQNVLQNSRTLINKASSISFMSSLLKKGADPNRRKIKGSNLIDSIQKGNVLLVEEFIKYGANINYCDETKKTALHYACNLVDLKERYEISAFLVLHGSYLNATSNSGERPLDVVVQNMIKEMSIEVHKAAEDKCSKLTIDLSVLNLLVCGGADLSRNIPTTYNSALFLLISKGLFQTAEYLLRCGWDVEKEEWFEAFDVSELDLENIRINYIIYKRHDIEAKKAEFKSFLQNFEKGPKSLAITCRKQIRHQLLLISNGTEIETKISTLPLPVKIKRFLSLKECIHENEILLLENDERTETNPVNAVQFLQALGLFGGLFPMQLQYDSDDYYDGHDYYYTDIYDY